MGKVVVEVHSTINSYHFFIIFFFKKYVEFMKVISKLHFLMKTIWHLRRFRIILLIHRPFGGCRSLFLLKKPKDAHHKLQKGLEKFLIFFFFLLDPIFIWWVPNHMPSHWAPQNVCLSTTQSLVSLRQAAVSSLNHE